MKKLDVLLLMFMLLISIGGNSQSGKNVVKIPKQKIEVLSGNPKYYKEAKSYFIQFKYSNLEIGGYDDEEAYIAYMREDAELRRKNADEWEEKWFSDRKTVYEPIFLIGFDKYANNKVELDTKTSPNNFELELHTQFIEIGYNRNFKYSPTYLNAIVTIRESNGSKKPLIISMKYIVGKEAFNVYSSDYRRVEEAYAKCGKELAKYMRKVIY